MPLSTDFLFISGDPNPRHSIEGMGEFYRIEILFLIIGVAYMLFSESKKEKLLLFGWIIFGIIPSALTKDGGNHATRLILILPPFIFLIGLGLYQCVHLAQKNLKPIFIMILIAVYSVSFISYEHLYWVHNPVQSERWWHAGWKEAITEVKHLENQYDNIVITTKDEPPWIFFAAFYSYNPEEWQSGYPFKEHIIKGFGNMSYIGKFSFGSPELSSLYDWGKILDEKTLFLASAKEVNVNLVDEPSRTPGDLTLLKTVVYPSGQPAFYLFTKSSK